MNEENFSTEKDIQTPETEINNSEPASDIYTDRVDVQNVYQTNPQAPPRYQSTGPNMYRQAPVGQEYSRGYNQPPVVTSYDSAPEAKGAKTSSRSMPGVIGFGFAASLLSIFLIPIFRDFFPIFLEAYSDPITYDRETYLMYFVLVLIYGGLSVMLSIFGLIFAPLGMNRAKRFGLDGVSLGSATILISIVSLLILIVSVISSLLTYAML